MVWGKKKKQKEESESGSDRIIHRKDNFDYDDLPAESRSDDSARHSRSDMPQDSDDAVEKTRILTEEELEELEQRQMQQEGQEEQKEVDTAWVDDLLSDIIVEKQAKKAQPMKEVKTTAPTPVSKTGSSTKETNAEEAEDQDFEEESAESAAFSDVEPAAQPNFVLEPLKNPGSHNPHSDYLKDISSIKEELTKLHMEIDEMMSTQTKLVRLLIDINEKIELLDSPPGTWKRIATHFRQNKK
ncbi:hypothetical protein ACFL27_07530 [candidate division CSSED10-310 bacterium]|uniref:Uncharacterized protein n=1 Tax=candidate division CSSED10-310 bacterium TaxID=2855610 RepID=A0ABV6YUZ3_UNCC1